MQKAARVGGDAGQGARRLRAHMLGGEHDLQQLAQTASSRQPLRRRKPAMVKALLGTGATLRKTSPGSCRAIPQIAYA
jgi:hypothetical protein